jgi:hypothetical protein
MEWQEKWNKGTLDEITKRWAPSYMKRREGRFTSIPFEARLIFKPRHGDVLLKFDEKGLPYDVWFWHKELGPIDWDSEAGEEEIRPPYCFAYPEFSIDYYSFSAEECNNFIQVRLEWPIFREAPLRSLAFELKDHPEINFVIEPYEKEDDNENITQEVLFGNLDHNTVALQVDRREGNTLYCNHFFKIVWLSRS